MHPSPASDAPASIDWLIGGGEMGRLIRATDWSRTPLGPASAWPQSLRTAVGLCLASRFPQLIWWGPERVQLYNDGYRLVLGAKHPDSLGQSGHECWSEIWDVVGPLYDQVRDTGESTWHEDLVLLMNRYGYREETYFTFSYSPIRDEAGAIGGVLVTCVETTGRVLGARRLQTLRELSTKTADRQSVEEVVEAAAGVLERNREDIPFALFYSIDEGDEARLAGSVGLTPDSPASPDVVHLGGATAGSAPPVAPGWPLARAVRTREAVDVGDLPGRFGPLPGGPWEQPPEEALVLPVHQPGHERPFGVLVGGISPLRRLDDEYRGFYELLASGLASAIASARAYEEERRRAEALSELDRAKTAFFSNVSHEFRTPLTLLLGPVEDLLADGTTPPAVRRELGMVHRNSLRLLRLVNTMLDFSRIEAGRIEAHYEPVELGAYTADLASVFRAAVERAGMRLVVESPPLPEPVYVDRDMWEKIVLNLLSNAFKYTLEGQITVRLGAADGHARLTVEDTGVGIPADEVPRLFERFHRVATARGRTHEGTGIGLALVQELVRLHGGTVHAESVLDEGSRFTVTVPLGTTHLDPRRLAAPSAAPTTGPMAFVEEALRWLPEPSASDEERPEADGGDAAPATDLLPPPDGGAAPGTHPSAQGARVLWADDNADMREYVARLLGGRFSVEAVPDGQAALEAARARPPDLVLSDVMMPRLDGFGLLEALRADPALRDVPVILLSARAGEEARIEGMEAGADDYLIKPFSARELLARVEAQVRLARLRRETEAALRESDERKAFLLEVSDALRELRDARHIMATAAACLARHLQADRVGYAEMDEGSGTFTVYTDWRRDGMPSLAGRHSLEAFGPALIATLRAGHTVILDDVTGHPLTAEAAAAFEAISTRAGIAAPLVKDGRFEAALFVHQREPRRWTDAEAALVDEVAERTWAAVGQAQAESALRDLNRTLEARVEERTRQVHALASRLTMAEQEERRRISHVLHDDLQQILYGIDMKLALVRRGLPEADPTAHPDLASDLDDARGWVARSITTTRHLTVDLSPPILQHEGLTDALEWLQRQMLELHGLTVDLQAPHAFELPDEDLRVLLFQIVRELLFNVKKHAGTDRATVTLAEEGGHLVVRVCDDGRGFDVDAVAAQAGRGGGFGLFSVGERLRLFGGRMEVCSRPGGGTCVEVWAPTSLD